MARPSTTEEATEIKRLRRENTELKAPNEILRVSESPRAQVDAVLA